MRNTDFETLPQHPLQNYRELAGNPALKPHFQMHARACGVNPHTMLCPDVLNPYARLVMLIELFPDYPQLAGQRLFAWRPQGYSDYFVRSKHPHADFIEAALRFAPLPVLRAFEAACDNLCKSTLGLIEAISLLADDGTAGEREDFCRRSARALRRDVVRVMIIADPEMLKRPGCLQTSPFLMRQGT